MCAVYCVCAVYCECIVLYVCSECVSWSLALFTPSSNGEKQLAYWFSMHFIPGQDKMVEAAMQHCTGERLEKMFKVCMCI